MHPPHLFALLAVAAGLAATAAVTPGTALPVAAARACTNVTLQWPAGTPLATIVPSLAHAQGKLVSVWRWDAGRQRFLGYSPVPGAPSDYPATESALDAVFVCTSDGDGPRPPFLTLPPGSPLPDGAACAAAVRRTGWEPRPQNAGANGLPGGPGLAGVRIDGASASFNARYAPRVDGNFTGTTDEILQWGACKWGFDEDIVRAVAYQESKWLQSYVGDAGQSFGILQVKRTVHKGTWPASEQSTAFNVDYALAWRRACYEGDFGWMRAKNPAYAGGDEWGCVGAWFSGNWYDPGAQDYIAKVQRHLTVKAWLTLGPPPP